MNNKLTVLIPTYNRKDKLLRTLKALSQQNNKKFDVFISDNNSDYSIEEQILPFLPEDFVSCLQVYHQPFNIGCSSNITGLLAICKSEWGWILADDDYVNPKAIDNIYSAFDKYPDANAFWFTIEETLQENVVLNTVEQFQKFLLKLNNFGDFGFCSNKVYRISALTGMDNVFNFTYSAIGFSFVLVEIVKNKEKVVVMGIDNALIVYGGVLTWSVNTVASGMRTLIDYPTGLSWKQHCCFVRSVMLPPTFVISQYIKNEKLPWNYKAILKNIYTNCYSFCYPLSKRLIIKPVFWFISYRWGWKITKHMLPHIVRFKKYLKERHSSIFHLIKKALF